MSNTAVQQFKWRLAERTGLDLGLLDQPGFDRFIRRRISELNLPDQEAYHELVNQDLQELERLVQEVSVAETWFFRYPASFQFVIDHTAKLLRSGQERLRMLSIACATGEEPYSMTMAAVAGGWPLERICIDAVDRNETSLATAGEASYRGKSFREEFPSWAHMWFKREGGTCIVDPRIVATVNYACRDILSPSLPITQAAYDVVYCRNLFIYLGSKPRSALVDYLYSILSSTGILFVGHAEYAILPPQYFTSAGVKHAFALRPMHSKACVPLATTSTEKPIAKTFVHRQQENVTVANPRSASSASVESHKDFGTTLENARAMANAGQADTAISTLECLIQQGPASSAVFELLGSIQLSMARFDQARDAFTKVLYFEPENETALIQMAIICARSGDFEQSARYRRRAATAHIEELNPPG
ncbi:MAG: CheR family methyltransferase [Pirellulales bacterium]